MINSYINKRQREILEIIINSEHVSVEQLQDEFGLSRRSVYYEIDKINTWLRDHELEELLSKRNKGFCFNKDYKKKTEKVLKELMLKEDSYIFTGDERLKMIYCCILMSGSKNIFVEDLSEYCKVSRNTIFADLSDLNKSLKEYSLKIDYSQSDGYRIVGDQISIRAIFLYYFIDLLALYKEKIIPVNDHEAIDQKYKKLIEIEKDLHVEYTEGILYALAALMSLQNNNQEIIIGDIKKEEIKNTNEYKLIDQYFEELNDNEKIYYSIQLLGSRTIYNQNSSFDTASNRQTETIVNRLIDSFEKNACIVFDRREELYNALYLHISSSMYRYVYGVQIGNPMLNEIKSRYKEIFQITRIASEAIEEMIGMPVNDSEAAYLTLHFGAFLGREKNDYKQLRIAIVCASGLSTGNMIKKEISKLIPNETVTEVMSADELQKTDEEYDLVISTVKIKTLIPTIVVNPILTDIDKNNILNHKLIRKHNYALDASKIIELARKYMNKENFELFVKDLNKYFNDKNEQNYIYSTMPRLLDVLDQKKTMTFRNEYSWQDAIQLSCNNLIENGSITEEYVQDIISQTIEYDAYMFIGKGIYLAHGRKDKGVNELDISFNFFNKEVIFPNNVGAHLIIVLAIEDQEKHLLILNQILELFSIQTRISELMNIRSDKSKYEYIRRALNN